MKKADWIRIQHMIDAAEEAINFANGKVREDLETDRMLVLSIIKDVEIIGEAASKVTQKARSEIITVPWKDIIGMRNRLIHGYFDVDLEIVWQTVVNDLPNLLSILRDIEP